MTRLLERLPTCEIDEPAPTRRTCKGCGATLPLDRAHFIEYRPGRFRHKCRECTTQERLDREASLGPDEFRRRRATYQRKHTYELADETYQILLSIQEQRCLLCDKEGELVGNFRDDPALLKRAAVYLERLSFLQGRDRDLNAVG